MIYQNKHQPTKPTSFNLTSPELCEHNQKDLSIIKIFFFFKLGIPNKLFVHIYCIHDPHVVYGSSAFFWLLLTKSTFVSDSCPVLFLCFAAALPSSDSYMHMQRWKDPKTEAIPENGNISFF